MSSSGSAFDDLLSEITGTGWYQKRLVYFLLAPIFFVVPFTFLHQIFVYNQNGKKQLQMYTYFTICMKLFWTFSFDLK